MRTVIQNQSLSVRRNGWDADNALVLDATFTHCELRRDDLDGDTDMSGATFTDCGVTP